MTRNGPLATLFRGSAMAKILDAIVDHRYEEMTKRDIADRAGVSWKTVWQELSRLENMGLIRYTGTRGPAKPLILNPDDAAVKNLVRFRLSMDPLIHLLLGISHRDLHPTAKT